MKYAKNLSLSALAIASIISLSACSKSEPAASTQSDTGAAKVELLNVSYDVSRDFYKEYNELFINHYKTTNPDVTVSIKQ